MARGRVKQKKGGLAKRPPLKRARVQSSTCEAEEEVFSWSDVVARIEAMENARGLVGVVATPASTGRMTRARAKAAMIKNILDRLALLEEDAVQKKTRMSKESFRDVTEEEDKGPGQGRGFLSTGNGKSSAGELPSRTECQKSGGSTSSLGQRCPPLGHCAVPAQVQFQAFGPPGWGWNSHLPANSHLPVISSGHQGPWLGYTTPMPVPLQPTLYKVPLGFHLLPATKEKIKKGEYVDMFSLLFREPDMEKLKQVDRSFNNWFPGYLIYAGVILEDQCERASALIHYLDIIYRASTKYSSSVWLRYDETFRMWAALNPSWPWDRELPWLWEKCMSAGEYSDSNHLIFQSQVDTFQGRMGKKSHHTCWNFNKRGQCSRRPCKFKHRCTICGAPHPRAMCRRFPGEQDD